MAHFQREYWEVVGECHQAMSQTAQMVLHDKRKSLAQLIWEIVETALEEEGDQVTVLRSIASALRQEARRPGGPLGVLKEESATLHYLYYTLTLMKCARAEREKCLHQAQALDHLMSAVRARVQPSGRVGEETDTKEFKRILKRLQRRSYLEMCRFLEEHGLVGQVNQHVRGLMIEWVSSRLNGLNEETRASMQKIIDTPIVWLHFTSPVAGGRTDFDIVDCEGRSRFINCEHLWQQLEDIG